MQEHYMSLWPASTVRLKWRCTPWMY